MRRRRMRTKTWKKLMGMYLSRYLPVMIRYGTGTYLSGT